MPTDSPTVHTVQRFPHELGYPQGFEQGTVDNSVFIHVVFPGWTDGSLK